MFDLLVQYNTIILNMNYGVNKPDDLKTGTPSVHKISPACSGHDRKAPSALKYSSIIDVLCNPFGTFPGEMF